MARPGKRHQSIILRNFDSLKAFYGVVPISMRVRSAEPPFFIGAYNRRSALSNYHIVGATREQRVLDAMTTYSPAVCSKPVVDLFREVASLLSVYYDTAEELRAMC